MGDWSGTVPSHAAFAKARASTFQTLDDIATALSSAWTSYSPTLTNLTLGNGTATANYRRIGKALDVKFRFLLGSTSAVGTSPAFSLPAGLTLASFYGDFDTLLGHVLLNDTGTAARGGFLYPDHTNNRLLIAAYTTAGVNQNITATVPHTWATTDYIAVTAMGIELA